MLPVIGEGEPGSRFIHVVAVIGLSFLIISALIAGAMIALQAVVDLIVSNLPTR